MSISGKNVKERVFDNYQIFIIAILATLMFTVILDFMVLSPLGAILMDELKISTSQFGLVVSAYAFSAGGSGLFAAGFADKFDRKKLLLFFYSGFLLGTVCCAIAPTFHFLLIARIVTGIFGGVIGSIIFAIITDLFKMEVRGRVMGFVQMAFAASQVLGIPMGLLVANNFGWHASFWMIAGFGVLMGLAILIYMKPIDEHLKLKNERHPFMHLYKTISRPEYLKAFLATTILATGGFMLMPFGSAFSIHNNGLTMHQLPILYGATGISTIFLGPQIGKLADKIGKYKIFVIGTIIAMIMIAIYCNLGITPLWIIISLNVILFIGLTSRMISTSTLITAIPDPKDRGAFMSINSSVQQISGGIASGIAGLIVVQTSSGKLDHYDTLGYVVVGTMIVSIFMVNYINNYVNHKKKPKKDIVEGELVVVS